jgi:glucose-6-phosphate dehydrogenase assembly protein OpcA
MGWAVIFDILRFLARAIVDLKFWLRDTIIFQSLKLMDRDMAIADVETAIHNLEDAIANLAEGDRGDADLEWSLRRHRKVLAELKKNPPA